MSTLDRPRWEHLVHFHKLIIMSSVLFTMMEKNEREIPFEIECTQKSFVCEIVTAKFTFILAREFMRPRKISSVIVIFGESRRFRIFLWNTYHFYETLKAKVKGKWLWKCESGLFFPITQ